MRGAIPRQLNGCEENMILGAIHESFFHGNFFKISYLNNWNISTFCFYSFQEFESAEEL